MDDSIRQMGPDRVSGKLAEKGADIEREAAPGATPGTANFQHVIGAVGVVGQCLPDQRVPLAAGRAALPPEKRILGGDAGDHHGPGEQVGRVIGGV